MSLKLFKKAAPAPTGPDLALGIVGAGSVTYGLCTYSWPQFNINDVIASAVEGEVAVTGTSSGPDAVDAIWVVQEFTSAPPNESTPHAVKYVNLSLQDAGGTFLNTVIAQADANPADNCFLVNVADIVNNSTVTSGLGHGNQDYEVRSLEYWYATSIDPYVAEFRSYKWRYQTATTTAYEFTGLPFLDSDLSATYLPNNGDNTNYSYGTKAQLIWWSPDKQTLYQVNIGGYYQPPAPPA